MSCRKQQIIVKGRNRQRILEVTPFPRKPRVNQILQQQQGFESYTGNSNCLLQSDKLARPEYKKNGADVAENQCWLGGTGSKGPALEVQV